MPFLLQVMPARSSAASAIVPGQLLRPEIDQHQMRIGAARDDREPAFDQRLGERLGVRDDRLRIVLELRLQRLAEGHRLGGDDMHQRPALQAGEDGAVDLLADLLVIARTMPPRGPRSVLCVVVVTTWACGSGLG